MLTCLILKPAAQLLQPADDSSALAKDLCQLVVMCHKLAVLTNLKHSQAFADKAYTICLALVRALQHCNITRCRSQVSAELVGLRMHHNQTYMQRRCSTGQSTWCSPAEQYMKVNRSVLSRPAPMQPIRTCNRSARDSCASQADRGLPSTSSRCERPAARAFQLIAGLAVSLRPSLSLPELQHVAQLAQQTHLTPQPH